LKILNILRAKNALTILISLLLLFLPASSFAHDGWSGVSTRELNDVDASVDPEDGFTLQYDITSELYVPQAAGAGSGDITDVGDVTSGAAFNGTQGTTLTFEDAGGDKTLAFDGDDFTFNYPLVVQASNSEVDAGADEVTNGDFTGDAAGWTLNGNWAYNANNIIHGSGDVLTATQTVGTVASGDVHYIKVKIGAGNGELVVSYGGQSYILATGATNYFIIPATSTAAVLTFTPTSDFDATVDDVWVKQLTSTEAVITLLEDGGSTGLEMREGDGNGLAFFGAKSGDFYYDGGSSVGLGPYTLRYLRSGTDNTAGGYSSQENQTEGDGNSSFGKSTLYYMRAGLDNSAFGDLALHNVTKANYNSGFGAYSLYDNKRGNNNTALGTWAGQDALGDGGVYLGYKAGTGDTASNKLYIANSDTANLIIGDFSALTVSILNTLTLGSATGDGVLVISDDDGGGDATVTIQALDGTGASYTLTLPPDDGGANEVLHTDGNGVLTWDTDDDSGGSTAWDDIADPDNDGTTTIDFDHAAEATEFTTAYDTAGSFLKITDSDADLANNVYLLDLDYSVDDGQANADYIKVQDAGGPLMTIQEQGKIVMTPGGAGTMNIIDITPSAALIMLLTLRVGIS